MPNVREMLQSSPWIGWAVAGLLLALSVFMFFRGSVGQDLYSPDRMREMVTIKFTDTGEEMEIPRGRLDLQLRQTGGKLDPTKGLINPKTGQPTGFPFSKSEWEDMCARINASREAMGAANSTAGSIRPGEPPAPTIPAPRPGEAAPAAPKTPSPK